MMRIECSRRPRKCPGCGNPLIGKILYGMPDFSKELEESLEKGEVILGGCCLEVDDPVWQCKKCGQQFWRKGAVPS
jgi:hypothetical protein